MSYRGCGIHIFQQTFNNLAYGDKFFDADYGLMIWNGVTWLNEFDFSVFEEEMENLYANS